MKHRPRFSVGIRMAALALVMSVALSAAGLLISYAQYTAQLERYYQDLGVNLTRALATLLSEEDLDYYPEDRDRIDEHFGELNDMVETLRAGSGVSHIYVIRPQPKQENYAIVLESAVIPGTDYARNSYDDLGSTLEMETIPLTWEAAEDGEPFAPYRTEDRQAGLLLTVGAPIRRWDGTFTGYYAMADIILEQALGSVRSFVRQTAWLMGAAAMLLFLGYLALVRRDLILPIKKLTGAARSYMDRGDRQAFRGMSFKGGYEFNDLVNTFQLMLAEIEVNNLEKVEMAVEEQRRTSDAQVAHDLRAAMRPKELPQREGGYPFALDGSVRHNDGMLCCFYDYFLLDHGRLCVLVGEAPGQELPQALFTVIAQTTLKSHLRSGLSLEQAMREANQQLYEMSGGRLSVNLLAGVLDGTTGRFACVNAGSQVPFLLRTREERYTQVDAFSYAPLGLCENVSYRALELELSQRDRLFFYTSGLSEIMGREGQPFGEDRIRLCLNERQTRQADLDWQLQLVGDAGEAYAAYSSQVRPYALLALEYCRRDRAQAHCVLTGDAAGAAALQDLLRQQLRSNRVPQEEAARVLVMADELFALCRTRGTAGGRFLAECVTVREEGLLLLRLRGAMGGQDPLDMGEDSPLRGSADFVRRVCDRVLFQSGEQGDEVTAVKRLESLTAGAEDQQDPSPLVKGTDV